MAEFQLKGNPCNTNKDLPALGPAPDFQLTNIDLSEIRLENLLGKRVVMNIFPSIDTPTCATSVRRFHSEASKLENTVVLCISRDLPFAQKRFCGSEGLDNVQPVSDFRTGDFGRDYGVQIEDGPLKGLLARSVIVLDEKGNIIYTQLVPETVDEPNYEAAISVL